MASRISSIDTVLSAAFSEGQFRRAVFSRVRTVTTNSTSSTGGTTMQRFPETVTMPTLGSGLASWRFTQIDLIGSTTGTVHAGIEYDMGTLTVSGGTFSAGVTMPTKTVEGVSLQTNALDPLVYIPTTLTGGGTPILTVTYTDQDGNTGQTATITLPSNAAVGTVCRLAAYLASGDSGVRAVTNMSLTASTGGVVKIIGYLPLQVGTEGTSVHRSSPQPIYDVQPIFPVDGGETIGFYRSGSNQVGDLVGVLVALGEE